MAIPKLTTFKLWTLQNFPFIAEDFDALTNYELMCKIVEYLNNVIDTTNQQSIVINELLNWFENLDVQEEVDHKLDEMAESGQLQEIIIEYLKLNGVLGFNTVADMKEATNLMDGSIAKTLGNQNYLDGKGAYYKIRELLNTDVIDEVKIIALENYPTLIAELVPESNPTIFDTLSDLKTSQNINEDDIVSTLGYHSINDGGRATYKVRAITNDDTPNDMDLIALYNEDLVAEFVCDNVLNLKQFGAYGDDENDDSDALEYAITYSTNNKIELYIPSGTYLINDDIAINNNIKGNQATLHFADGGQSFYVEEDSTFELKDLTLDCTGHAIQINNEGNINSTIQNCKISSTGYGVLVNNNTDGGYNLRIKDNNIYAKSDPIEINTTHTTDDKFNSIIIDGNILEVDDSGTSASSGFAIGVANGKNIIINNNIVNYSRQEAIHVEDGSEDIIVTNNIIKDCENDGIRILSTTSKSIDAPIISNNSINSSNEQGIGIRGIYDSNGNLRYANITNNKIKGFATGVSIGGVGYQAFNLDGTIIEGCNRGLQLPNLCSVNGNVTIKNCNTGLYASGDRSNISIESMTFDTPVDPTTFIISTKNNSIINFRRLTIRFRYEASATGTYHYINICPMPHDISGTVSFKVIGGGGEVTRNGNISWDNSTFTFTSLNNYTSNITANLIEDSGKLQIKVNAPNLAVGGSLNGEITIEGNFTIAGLYNN